MCAPMAQYPVLLNLSGRLCVVVGGGEVAERKIDALLACAARVRAIAPSFAAGIEAAAAQGNAELRRRAYREGDLAGALLAIAATDDAAVNQAVWREAIGRGILVNVVDDPARCTFTLPATVRRGSFLLTVSTEGASPALARAVRERLEEEFGPEYAVFTAWLGELRARVKSLYPEQQARERVWQSIVRSDALERLRRGDDQGARDTVEAIIGAGAGA